MNPAYHDTSKYKRPRDCKGHVVESQKKALDLLRKACGLKDDSSCEVVKAYDEKPGPVRIELGEFNEDWAFEFPEDGEPKWDDFEQK
jgi:TPR repeat protein